MNQSITSQKGSSENLLKSSFKDVTTESAGSSTEMETPRLTKKRSSLKINVTKSKTIKKAPKLIKPVKKSSISTKSSDSATDDLKEVNSMMTKAWKVR